jgi:hypothetical protein
MNFTRLTKTALALATAVLLGYGVSASAAPNVSSNPDTDAFRTGGCTGCLITQMNAATAQFSAITRVFRACYTGGTIVDDGGGCADGTHGALADFFVLQGTLKDSLTDPNGLGVPNGPTLGEVTYRVSGNGSGNGINCSRTSSQVGMGFLAPEGFDGTPNTSDDAGGSGSFGVVGAGVGANTATMTAPPLTQCNTHIGDYVTVAGTTLPAAANQLCVVNFDLNSNGSIANDQAGAAAPGGLVNLTTKSDLTTLAGNESTNLKLSCDTGFADLPPGDFLPPKDPFNQQDVFGAQIFKIAISRDAHDSTGVDKKIHLNDPQLEGLFGEPAGNSVCRLNHVGGTSTAVSQNVTACIRAAGSGSRETFRNTFMADTAGSKTQSEDNSGVQNGTVTTCVQPKQGGGSQISQKRVKTNPGNADVINCLGSFTGSVGYIDADRFDNSFYGAVVEGVDPDAATLASSPQTLKDEVRCGHYRYWGPLSGGVGQHNPGGSAFITAHRAALKNGAVYTNALAYLPLGSVGFTKNATDGSYSISFIPTACSGGPAPEISISASPTTKP